MKPFVVVVSLALGALSFELPSVVERDGPTLVDRDIATVTSAVTQVDSGLKNLDTAVQGFSSDPADMNSAADALLRTLNTATMQIMQTSNITVEDALSLQSTVTSLQKDGETLINDLEAKKSAIQAAGLCGSVMKQTSDISTASQMLIAAVIAKLPESVQSVGNQLAAGVADTLNRPMQIFSSANCTQGASPTGPGPLTSPPRPAPTASIFANTTTTRTTTTRSSTAAGTVTPFTNAAVPVGAGPVGMAAGLLAALVL